MGAANEASVPHRSDWCWMWNEYHDLGKKLAAQTPYLQQVVRDMIYQTEEHFPNFNNPYLGE